MVDLLLLQSLYYHQINHIPVGKGLSSQQTARTTQHNKQQKHQEKKKPPRPSCPYPAQTVLQVAAYAEERVKTQPDP